MLKSISWGEYAFWLAIALLAYYAVVGLLYYRTELQNLVQRGRPPKPQELVATPAAAAPNLLAMQQVVRPNIMEPAPVPEAQASLPAVVEAPEDDSEEQEQEQEESEETEVEPTVEPEPVKASQERSELIGVEQLDSFLDKVQAGKFNKEEVPAALENTDLLQQLFTASLSKRRPLVAALAGE